ncbi:MAG: hypothetical protein LUI13_15435 [Lachnospiraceae bacterium]|nr:hypothetical protein [Lachnospiraceae bacterium]
MIRIKYVKRWPTGFPYTASKAFERLTDNIGSTREKAEPPFRDSLSKSYLHRFLHAHMVKGDWFSVELADGRRIPIYALPQKDKFVLAALNDSRRGTKNPGIQLEALDKARWNFLSNLSFDIWLKASDEEFRNLEDSMSGCEACEIMNYPFCGESVEVRVLSWSVEDHWEKHGWKENDQGVHEPRSYVPEGALFTGPFGRYYTDWRSLRMAFWGSWMADIEKTKELLSWKWEQGRRWYLNDITREWSMDSFIRMIAGDEAEPRLRYLIKKSNLHGPCRVVTHMISVPPAAEGPVSIWEIDKFTDGSYYLHDHCIGPFLGLPKMLPEAVEERRADCERVELLVQEDPQCKCRFQAAICGLKIREDCIEIFEKGLAEEMFLDALGEACQSGSYRLQAP